MNRIAALASLVAIFLAAGCGGSSTTSVTAGASPGETVFANAGCGTCHTLAAAHATGTVGKKLDGTRLSAATVEHWVRSGGGGMPAFSMQLSPTQIRQVSEFVAGASQ